MAKSKKAETISVPMEAKTVEELREEVKPFPPEREKKRKCPVTLGEFQDDARPVTITIGRETVEATVKQFSSGSFGWNINGKVTIDVGGVPVRCQVTGNLIAIGSKPED